MHGVLKCIAGDFQVASYSAFTDNKDIPLPLSLANYEDKGTLIFKDLKFIIEWEQICRPLPLYETKLFKDLLILYAN